jgi:two-component system cell cycle response regulator
MRYTQTGPPPPENLTPFLFQFAEEVRYPKTGLPPQSKTRSGFASVLMPLTKRSNRDLRPALVFLTGELLAVPIPLDREEVILGRALEADVRVNDSRVSRIHAKITATNDNETGATSYLLTDLEAPSGTFLNGERISEETLHNGDKITIGKHILRFELLDEIDREYQHQIRRLLAHDDLTGLLSSRSFFSELRREAARAKQNDLPFCVLMMDIDHFKNVNDTYGHLTGSKTIEEIGLCITSTLRNGDVASRFGGEEFAAFLLDAEINQALVAAERIRQTIENQAFSVIKQGKPSGIHHITMSIGISAYPVDSEDPIELVEMADSALYRAKRLGRNMVCAYRDLTEEELSGPLPPRRE